MVSQYLKWRRMFIIGLLLGLIWTCPVSSQNTESPGTAEVITFNDLRFRLTEGSWVRLSGPKEDTQVVFIQTPNEGHTQVLSVWIVEIPPHLLALKQDPELLANVYWDYEEFQKARPEHIVWTSFERQSRIIAGKTFPCMTYKTYSPDINKPQGISYGVFFAVIPGEVETAPTFYIIQAVDVYRLDLEYLEAAEDLSWLDTVIESITIAPTGKHGY